MVGRETTYICFGPSPRREPSLILIKNSSWECEAAFSLSRRKEIPSQRSRHTRFWRRSERSFRIASRRGLPRPAADACPTRQNVIRRSCLRHGTKARGPDPRILSTEPVSLQSRRGSLCGHLRIKGRPYASPKRRAPAMRLEATGIRGQGNSGSCRGAARRRPNPIGMFTPPTRTSHSSAHREFGSAIEVRMESRWCRWRIQGSTRVLPAHCAPRERS